MKVYGIPNCNTVKKAIDWLKENQVGYEFHDYKKKGITKDVLKQWTAKVGWEKLVNKKGTTWRAIAPGEQQKIKDERSAIKLMIEQTSVIKRPVIETPDELIVGFDEEEYQTSFKSN